MIHFKHKLNILENFSRKLNEKAFTLIRLIVWFLQNNYVIINIKSLGHQANNF